MIRVTGQSAHLVWSGTADATTWDLKTTQNWKNSDNANATDKFFNGDFVTFDDTGTELQYFLGRSCAGRVDYGEQ